MKIGVGKGRPGHQSISPGWSGLFWIVEGTPKDGYYNYGKQIFYIDKVSYSIYFKMIHDKAGQYWKTVYGSYTAQVTRAGRRYLPLPILIILLMTGLNMPPILIFVKFLDDQLVPVCL